MWDDLLAAAGLVILLFVGIAYVTIRGEQTRRRRRREAEARKEQQTTYAIMMTAQDKAGELSHEERALAGAWYWDQWTKYGKESDLQRLIELQDKEE